MLDKNSLRKLTVRELEEIASKKQFDLRIIQPLKYNIPPSIAEKSIEIKAMHLTKEQLIKWRLLKETRLFMGGREYEFETFLEKEVLMRVVKKFDKYGTYTYDYYVNGKRCTYRKSDIMKKALESSIDIKKKDAEINALSDEAERLILYYKSVGGVNAMYRGGRVSPK